MTQASLREIALGMGTDKEGAHTYADAYEHHLGHLRDEPITLLEIGIGGYADPDLGGASLRMWREYFPRARILGLDIEDKSRLAADRITILQGSQADRAFLERMAVEHGPFDIVIDDGSHRCRHVIASFETLFPHLTERGIYVIEDLQTSYWETYGGSSDPSRPGTSMARLKSLVDGLNYAEFDLPSYQPTYTDRWVAALTFYHNLVFIQKGPNLEPSNILPPHPRLARRFVRTRAAKRRARLPRRVVRSVVPLEIRRAVRALGRSVRGRVAGARHRRRI